MCCEMQTGANKHKHTKRCFLIGMLGLLSCAKAGSDANRLYNLSTGSKPNNCKDLIYIEKLYLGRRCRPYTTANHAVSLLA